jgi:NAD-dependent deacetylase
MHHWVLEGGLSRVTQMPQNCTMNKSEFSCFCSGIPTMKVLILTGAGISAESGIPTFRDNNGLWEGHRFEDVATPEAFERDGELVHNFYNQRRRGLLAGDIQPNDGHLSVAQFEADHDDEFLLVTQNVDDLHQRAGSKNVLPMHGELLKARCIDSGELFEWREDLTLDTPHPHAPSRRGRLRPHVVWFGVMPIGLERIEAAAEQADLFIAIGTSAVVYPAAGIVQATGRKCRTVEINLDETPQSSAFSESIRGKASIEVPKFLQTV